MRPTPEETRMMLKAVDRVVLKARVEDRCREDVKSNMVLHLLEYWFAWDETLGVSRKNWIYLHCRWYLRVALAQARGVTPHQIRTRTEPGIEAFEDAEADQIGPDRAAEGRRVLAQLQELVDDRDWWGRVGLTPKEAATVERWLAGEDDQQQGEREGLSRQAIYGRRRSVLNKLRSVLEVDDV